MLGATNSLLSPIEFNVDIRFHTEDVDVLFCGRDRQKKGGYIPRYPIVARVLHGIYAQMLADNPFAESMLIEFDIHFDQLFGLVDTRVERCQTLAAHAQDQEGITLRPITRRQPFLHEAVATFNEYGRCLLRGYGRIDLAVRWLRTINGAALMESKLAEQFIRELLRRQRALNEVIIGYAKRLRPVTRQEVLDGSQRARELAQAVRRRVAPDVLNKQRRCRFFRVRSMAKPWDAPGRGLYRNTHAESERDPNHSLIEPTAETEAPSVSEPPIAKEELTHAPPADISTARHCGRKRQE